MVAAVTEEYQFTSSGSTLPLALFLSFHQNLSRLSQQLTVDFGGDLLLKLLNLVPSLSLLILRDIVLKFLGSDSTLSRLIVGDMNGNKPKLCE